MFGYAVHYGVIPSDDDPNFCTMPLLVVNGEHHNNPEKETLLWRDLQHKAWVSGSWACWGPFDQDVQGDKSLHVLIQTDDDPTIEMCNSWRFMIMDALEDGDGRLLPYAYISTDDHSEILKSVIFDVSGTEFHKPLGK